MTRRDRRGRGTGRRALAALLGVAAVASLVVGLRPVDETGSPPSGATGRLATPVWSARRVPQPFVEAVGVANLQATLDALAAGTRSCFRVDVDRLGTVAQSGVSTPVTPASTQKVLIAAGALGALGPGFTFTTRAVANGAPRGGVVDALWLVGGGDPVLSTPGYTATLERDPDYQGLTNTLTPLATLADSIVAAGVRSIPDGVVGDGSAYTTPPALPTWKPSYRTEIGPLGALVVDDGFDPVTRAQVADPALAAAAQLSALLVARGVAVGPPSVGTAPARAGAVASIQSAPLPQLVTELLSASDNGTAEALALAVGKATTSTGTVPAGVAGILAALGKAGIDLTGVALDDGSGLSPQNTVTCTALLQTLDLGVQPLYRPVVEGLAIAGLRGTLRARFAGAPIAGRLRGKTGTLDGVAGLIGLFDLRDGTGTPRFTTVFNGAFSPGGGDALTTRAVEAVSAFPQSPPAGQLVPLP